MEERITPKQLLAHLLPACGAELAEADVAPTVIGSWNAALIHALAEKLHARQVPWPNHPLYTAHSQDVLVSLIVFPVGAPAAVSAMEMLVAGGAKKIIGVGLTGSLQRELHIGDVVLASEAFREEGTSYHYFPGPEKWMYAAPNLLRELETVLSDGGVAFHKGKIWTTDAIFRELVSKVEHLSAEHVLSVEMETSALYAVGAFRKVDVCNLLVVTDSLWGEWNPHLVGSPEVARALEKVGNALTTGLSVLQQVRCCSVG